MAQHTTSRLYCTKDTHVLVRYPTQNFHNEEYTNIGKAGSEQAVGLFAFNTSHGISSGAKIISAKMYFSIDYASNSNTYTFVVRPCAGSWTETGVTYNTLPSTSDISDTVSIGNSTTSIDITNTFNAWFTGKYAMANGLYITSATEDSRKRLRPKGYATEDLRPYLQITWEDPISIPVADKTTYALGETLRISIQGAGSGRTHTLTYKIGENVVRTVTDVGASDSYALPLDLANYITTSTSATMTIVCETFMDGTSQGTASTTAGITVPESVKPTISSVTAAETVSNWPSTLSGKWVQGVSKPQLTITASGAYGSSIARYSTTLNNQTVQGAAPKFGQLSASGNLVATTTVTDTRGRTATYSLTLTVLAYAPPQISGFQISRCDESGNYQDSGTYARISAVVSISSLEGLNTFWARPDYKANGSASWITSGAKIADGATSLNITNQLLGFGGIFDEMTGYNFRLYVVDALTSSIAYNELPTRAIVWDVSRSGRSVGFGVEAGVDGDLPFGLNLKQETDAVRAQSMQNLAFLGINPDFEDTTVNWGAKGPCYVLYSKNSNSVTNQPHTNGFLISIPYGPSGNYGEVRQIWASQHTGGLYHRGGNANGWTSWKQMIDSAGGMIDGVLSVAGDFTAKNGVLLPETEQGLTGKLSADYGGIVLESSNSDSANKRMLSVDNLTFQSDTRYAMRVIEIREGVYSAYYVPAQTNWIELTPADGVTTPGEHGNGALRYRAEGKHVYLAGSVNVAWDGTNNKLIATLPSGYRPSQGDAVHSFQVTGGNKIARIYVAPTGEIYLEWKRNLSDGSSATDDNWLEVNMDFWTD